MDTPVSHLLISRLHCSAWGSFLCCGASFSAWSISWESCILCFLIHHFSKPPWLQTAWVGVCSSQPKGNLPENLHMDKVGPSFGVRMNDLRTIWAGPKFSPPRFGLCGWNYSSVSYYNTISLIVVNILLKSKDNMFIETIYFSYSSSSETRVLKRNSDLEGRDLVVSRKFLNVGQDLYLWNWLSKMAKGSPKFHFACLRHSMSWLRSWAEESESLVLKAISTSFLAVWPWADYKTCLSLNSFCTQGRLEVY